MNKIREFTFDDFTSAIKNQLGKAFDAKVEENKQGLKLIIFDEAAKNDGGENDELFETNESGKFNELVDKGVKFVLHTLVDTMGEKVKAALAKLLNKDEKPQLTEKKDDDNDTFTIDKYNRNQLHQN